MTRDSSYLPNLEFSSHSQEKTNLNNLKSNEKFGLNKSKMGTSAAQSFHSFSVFKSKISFFNHKKRTS